MTNENRECTKAMAAIEARFCGNQKRSAVITQEEFRAISDYIETLEYDLGMRSAINEDYAEEETVYIPDKYEQARESVRMRWEHLNDMRNHKLVMK